MSDIVVILLLILLNGVFSMSEVALISARKSRLSSDAKRGSGAARKALALAEDPDRFLSTVQIGITLIGILTGMFSGAALADGFAEVLMAAGLAKGPALAVAKISILIVVTYLSIVVGELVPKRLGLSAADSVAKMVARPMTLLSKITLPAVWLLSKSTNLIVRMLHLRNDGNKVTEEEIKSLIQEGTSAGEVQVVEQDIMERALVMGDQRVSSIMTAKMELAVLDVAMGPEAVYKVISEEYHSSYPVLESNHEEALGVVDLKDLIPVLGQPGFSLSSVMRRGVFFPESMRVYDALEVLRNRDVRCGLVCDEYGSLQGIVTLCDVLEGLVGTLYEAHEQPDIVERTDATSWLVDGRTPVYDFLAFFDREDGYVPANYTTVAGLVLEQLRRLPLLGERFEWNGFSFEIVDMDGARIDKLLVRKVGASECHA